MPLSDRPGYEAGVDGATRRALFDLRRTKATMLRGVATGANQVLIDGEKADAVLPYLSAVILGDDVIVLEQGDYRVILGKVT